MLQVSSSVLDSDGILTQADLEKHRNEVLLFGVLKSLALQKIVTDFENAITNILTFIYNEFDGLRRLFYTLQSAVSVSEEYIDGNIYLYIQSKVGSSFVHVRNSRQVELLNAYFYLYHFKEYCQLHFVQLTKFGNEKDLELSNCIWATMVISNWKVFSEHVNYCLSFLNK